MATEREIRLAELLDTIDAICDNAVAPYDDGDAAKFKRISDVLLAADWLNADIVNITQYENADWRAANPDLAEDRAS